MQKQTRPSLLKKAILGTFKPNVTRLKRKDLYFNSYYFPENICDGVDLVAALERTSKKDAA